MHVYVHVRQFSVIVVYANVIVVPYIYTTGVYASDSIDSDQEPYDYVVKKKALESQCSSIV